MKKIVILLTLAAMVFITGCSEREITTEQPSVSDAVSNENSTHDTANGSAVGTSSEAVAFDEQVKGVEDYTGFTDEGIYYELHFGVNHFLTYIDLATMQQVFLCSTPNCTHSDDSCPAYFHNGNGKALITATPSHDNSSLFMLTHTSFAEQNASTLELARCELSGANPEVIYFAENEGVSLVAVGEKHLYAEISNNDSGGLYAINLSSKEKTLLFLHEYDNVLFPSFTAYGDSIYVVYDRVEDGVYDPTDPMKSPESREFTIDRINLISGETETLYKQTLASDEYLPGMLYKGQYYINNHFEGSEVKRLNYETGEIETLGDFGDVNQFSSLVSYIDGYFTIVDLDEENERRYYTHMNIETGEVIETPFTYNSSAKGSSFNVEMKVIADLGDELVLQTDETLLTFEVYNEFEEKYDYPTNPVHSYAIISEADYFAGIDNMRPIDNSMIIEAFS